MLGPSPTLKPGPASEVESAITLNDFYRVWYAWRVWFLVGLALVAGLTLISSKFFMPKFYRAQATLFVGWQVSPEQRVGLADIQGANNARPDQYTNVVKGVLAERLLLSNDLITTAAWRLQHPKNPKFSPPIDLYAILGVNQPTDEMRQLALARLLRESLMKIAQVQNSGVIELSVELPSSVAASRFVNAAIDALRDKFTQLDFGYYDRALAAYEDQLKGEESKSKVRSEELAREWSSLQYDASYPRMQRRAEMAEDMKQQATRMAALRDRIAKLRIGTSVEAKAAAQSVKVIDPAMPPQKKIRPKVLLNTAVSMVLYTFIFMIGVAAYSYFGWVRRSLTFGARA